MKQIITYSLLFLAVLAISFGFSNKEEEGKVHFIVTKEENGGKYIEIDIKRDASLNVTISEFRKNDAELQDIKMNFKNNLNPSQLRYYPNPNNGQFDLKFQLDSKEEVTVKVMDILGNEVYKEKLMDFNGIYDNEINLIGREKGIYILQISQKKKALTRKILIE